MSKKEEFFVSRKSIKTVGDYNFSEEKDKESCGLKSEVFNEKIKKFGLELRKAFDEFFENNSQGSIVARVAKKHEDYFTKRELAYLLSVKFLGEVEDDLIKKDKEDGK